MSISDITINEGTGGTFLAILTIEVSDTTCEASVLVSTTGGSATPDDDYSPVVDEPKSFSIGDSVKTVSFEIVTDALLEMDETINVVLSNVVGATLENSKATVTIMDDDTSEVSIMDVSQEEGAGDMEFIVSITNPIQGGATVNYATMDGSAQLSDNDYLASANNLMLASEQDETLSIFVTIPDDGKIESDESFFANLSGLVAHPGVIFSDNQAEAVVLNDDGIPAMGEWGIVVLALLTSIIGVLQIDSRFIRSRVT